MRLRLLGAVEAEHGGQPVELGRRRERFLLALLMLDLGRVVPAERLTWLLWDGDPPAGAMRSLQIHVSRLRARLRTAGDAGPRLVASGGGYVLQTDPDSVDAMRFRRLVDRAHEVDDLDDRARLLRSALQLWRGPALAGVTTEEQRRRLAAGLDELRQHATALLYEQELALGRHARAVTELTELVERDPLRERLVGLLLTALHRDGRTADALDLYRQTRARMVEELGVEPGPTLRELHESLLRTRLPRTDVAPASAVSTPNPAQLPAVPGGFAGRAVELHALHALAETSDVIAIVGAPGVGKTALAVRWAHDLVADHPDGQLFVNLHGFAPAARIRPADALAGFLRALTVPPARIPTDVDEASALFRSQLAGRRMLVVLDNRRQRRPGPAAAAGLRLDCGRHQPGRAHRPGRARGRPHLHARSDAAAGCRSASHGDARSPPRGTGRLRRARLRLRVPSACPAYRRGGPQQPAAGQIGPYVAALADGRLLNNLEIDDDPGGSVRGAFASSYHALAGAARHVFALLGLVPGVDVAVPAAAALVGWPAERVRRALRQLADAHLIEVAGPDRYALHDLIRLFASERAQAEIDPDTCGSAMVRFRRHHLVRAHAAARLLNPQMLRLPAEDLDEAEQPFPDPAQARAWLNAEYANLLALVHERTGGGANAAVFRLADAMRGFLWLRYDLPQWVGVASAALAAAEEAVDDHAIVSAQISLAQALHCCGEYRAGVEMYERALVRAGAIGWTQAQATAIGNSAVIWLGLGEQRRCIRYCRESIALYRDLGQRSGEAVNVGTMGLAYLIGGELRQARRRLSAAAQLHRGLHTDSMLVMSLCHLGETCRQIGEHERAGALLAEALELAQRIGARSAESVASHYRAALHLDRAETAEAEAWARRSLAISEETGNSFASAYANVVLGMAHRHAGRFADAIDCHQRALAFARSSHERHPRCARSTPWPRRWWRRASSRRPMATPDSRVNSRPRRSTETSRHGRC
jgi:DNA-binding SARP family transcriptional activator